MTTKLITNNFKNHQIDQFIESISETANTAYYLFIGNHKEEANSTVATLYDVDDYTFHNIYDNMIVGKRIAANNVAPLIRSITYTSNTKYAMYDHRDIDLPTKDFFVKVDEGSYSHVYKCLDNNNNNYSTSQPTFSHISGANLQSYRTSDGYVWKYMYSYDSTTKTNFETEDYIPVIVNNDVVSTASANKIPIIKVDGQGRKYDNYVTGTFANFDLAIGGNTKIYQISNNGAATANGFYTGCLMYISSGTGSGQNRKILDYFSNSSGKYVVLQTPFTTAPTNGSQYEVYPEVVVRLTGKNTSNVIARALVNSLATNSIYRVEIFNYGNNYSGWASANVIANAVVGVQSEAELIPILPPMGGHGSNPAKELYSSRLEISIKLSNTESSTIPAINNFKQLGILKDPMFANVGLAYSNIIGTFLNGELVYKISPHKISIATTNDASNSVTLTLDDYHNNLTAGDLLYLYSNNLLLNQLVNLGSIVSNTEITLTENAYFTSTDTVVYRANESTSGNVNFSNTNTVFLTNVRGTFTTGDVIVGTTSGAKLIINNVIINETVKYFNTFIGMHSIAGTLQSGSFIENENAYQFISDYANVIIHSSNSTVLYYTNQKGELIDGLGFNLTGNTSGAIFEVNSVRAPEIVYGSGEVIFVENVEEVERNANTTEQFQIVFEY